jgi:hypothetical protein
MVRIPNGASRPESGGVETGTGNFCAENGGAKTCTGIFQPEMAGVKTGSGTRRAEEGRAEIRKTPWLAAEKFTICGLAF